MGEFLDGEEGIEKHGGDLPHWQQGEVMLFVTFRLADAMPAGLLRQWKEQRETFLQVHPEPWDEPTKQKYHKRFTGRIERWLDQGHGSCLLRNSANRMILEGVMREGEGCAARFEAWVIMPNHVHLLFAPLRPMAELIKIWKGVSARKIGQGSIWQKNYRDTLIRDSIHYANAVRYIRRNPAKLNPGEFSLWQSERAQGVLRYPDERL